MGHVFHDLDGVARTDARQRVAHHLGSQEAVETLQLLWTHDGFDRDQRRDRNHAAGAGTHIHLTEIVRRGPIQRVGLQLHSVGTAIEIEVVDVQRSHRGLQTLIHIRHRHVQRQGLGLIHFHVELRRGGPEKGVDASQFRTLFQGIHELLHHLGQGLRIAVAAGLDIHFETAGGAQTPDRRRIEHQPQAVGQHHAHPHEFLGQIVGDGGAFVPVLERDEHRAGVGFLTAADDVPTGDHEYPVHRRVGGEPFLKLLAGDPGALQAGAVGQHQGADQIALILGWHEAAGHGAEHVDATADHQGEHHGADDPVMQGHVHRAGVGPGKRLEQAVERLEQRRFLVLDLEQQGA